MSNETEIERPVLSGITPPIDPDVVSEAFIKLEEAEAVLNATVGYFKLDEAPDDGKRIDLASGYEELSKLLHTIGCLLFDADKLLESVGA